MKDTANNQNKQKKKIANKNLIVFLLIESILGLITLIWILIIPKDVGKSLLFGFSSNRLLIIIIQFVLFSIPILFGIGINIKNNLCLQIIRKIENIQITNRIKIAAFGLLIIDLICLILFPLIRNTEILPYLVRVQPLIIWLFFSCANIVLFLVFTEWKSYCGTLKMEKRVQKTLALIFIIFLLIICFIYFTKIGFTRDPAYWDVNPPVPILEWQIIFLLVIITFIFLIQNWIKPEQRTYKSDSRKWIWLFDIIVFIFLWAITIYFWNSQPIPNSYFTPTIRPPNFEKYPFSDARIYDSNSLSILNGNMAQDQYVIRKPLYSIFLAVLHFFGGQKYEMIVLLQIIVLALTPAIIYLIGVSLNNRIMGFVLALSVFFREFNTLSVASLTTTSNSKLLMTELPTALILSVLLLVIIKWHNASNKQSIYSLLVGGVLGILVLTRSQSLILIPFIVLIFLLTLIKFKKQLLIQSLLFVLGLLLVISPWLYRNYKISGQFALEDQTNTSDMVNRISGMPVAEYQGISVISTENGSMFNQVIFTMLNHPMATLGFISNHFVNNIYSSLQILPLRQEKITNFDNVFLADDLFWLKQDKNLNAQQVILLTTFLIMIILGIVGLYTSLGIMGLAPLILFLGYCFSSAITRISGWRFTIPIDWVVLLYFWVGLIEFVKFFLRVLNIHGHQNDSKKSIDHTEPFNEMGNFKKVILLFVLLLLFCGLSLPSFVYSFSGVYANQSRYNLINKINPIIQNSSIPLSVKEKTIPILNSNSVNIEEGIGYYPRFYERGDGEPINQNTVYYLQEYPRLLFYFIGEHRTDVMLRSATSPENFPNASEVIIVTKTNGSYDDAYFVIVKTDRYWIYLNDEIIPSCLLNPDNILHGIRNDYSIYKQSCINQFSSNY
jgi:hypothetical protein